jgi:hypothetical protein
LYHWEARHGIFTANLAPIRLVWPGDPPPRSSSGPLDRSQTRLPGRRRLPSQGLPGQSPFASTRCRTAGGSRHIPGQPVNTDDLAGLGSHQQLQPLKGRRHRSILSSSNQNPLRGRPGRRRAQSRAARQKKIPHPWRRAKMKMRFRTIPRYYPIRHPKQTYLPMFTRTHRCSPTAACVFTPLPGRRNPQIEWRLSIAVSSMKATLWKISLSW